MMTLNQLRRDLTINVDPPAGGSKRKNMGARNGSSKLQAKDILALRAAKRTDHYFIREQAAALDVSRETIKNVVLYRTWGHI